MTLRLLLLVAIGLTITTLFQKLFGLSAPLPERQAPLSLPVDGYRVTPMASGPAAVGRDFSHGTIRRFKLEPKPGGSALIATLMPVRARREKTLQLAGMAALEPSFALRNRRILVGPPSRAGNVSDRPEELALGTRPGPSAAPASRLQGCLTALGGSGVTLVSLQKALYDSREAERAQAPWRIAVSRLLGLRPNARWECLVVQLETPQSPIDPHALWEPWRSLTNQLRRLEDQ
ncbi:MAG: hypothetical protein VKO39_04690 [Cyanobacteriota bacterium]|nr:hypothetical protein [Cyanobacteriota bacterium]